MEAEKGLASFRSEGICCTGNVRIGHSWVCICVTREYDNYHNHVIAINKKSCFIFSDASG